MLAYTERARSMDTEASEQWGLDPFALVEAAGRVCAEVFIHTFLKNRKDLTFAILAGNGNNAADALVMLRALVLSGYVQPSSCMVYISREQTGNSRTPLSLSLLSVKKLGIPITVWNENGAALANTNIIIDGIAGTGLNGPLHGAALSMTESANNVRHDHGGPLVVSIDIPSGNFDGWQPGMPIITAHATLAIEPQKLCLYSPLSRPHAGTVLPVGSIFPPELIQKYSDAELVTWGHAAARIPCIPVTAHKYERGLVEIRAGSAGATGAARLAAMGAQAAGAGLVRLIVDPSLYGVIAPACTGVMVVPGGAPCGSVPKGTEENRFSPSALQNAAVLLGPGWGRGEDRERLFAAYLPGEKNGIPLILDADAITLAKSHVFNGNAILTPHPGEFAAYTGLSKESILTDPVPVLLRYASEKKVTILFKSHVLYAVSPDGRVGVIDGMNPMLGAGGMGDVLAGLCAAIAARMARQGDTFDGYTCVCAAASLLIQAGQSTGSRFSDPAEIAQAAAAIAGAAWLPKEYHE